MSVYEAALEVVKHAYWVVGPNARIPRELFEKLKEAVENETEEREKSGE